MFDDVQVEVCAMLGKARIIENSEWKILITLVIYERKSRCLLRIL